MSLYSTAPPTRPFSDDKPTLLVCWWITAFCATFILLRVTGRLVRVEKLFREDSIAAAALIPLFVRMGLVHVILLYGTNNVALDGLAFSEVELARRSTGSRLVLLSRIFDAATLWTLKAATLEFFRRLKGITKEKSSARAMLTMRLILLVTFIAVVISTLAECKHFTNYWQVKPDPGGQCRQGFANLLTMAVCNIMTDVLLVLYPLPIIVSSRIPMQRKVFLVCLFILPLATVIVSIYRLPQVLSEDGYQATRSMWASVEILVATVAANTLALASFVRDLGAKKAKFKFDPMSSGRSQRLNVKVPNQETWHGRGLESQAVMGNDTNIASSKVGFFGVKPKNSLDMREEKERDPSPNRSLDSLIPRGQQVNVTKTTEIEVTVTDIGTLNRQLSQGRSHRVPTREPSQTVTASNRGQARGSTRVLKDMDSLPR